MSTLRALLICFAAAIVFEVVIPVSVIAVRTWRDISREDKRRRATAPTKETDDDAV